MVGGGVAGLACARTLQTGGLRALVLEAHDAPGGRVRTDEVEGFRLDRGFQVLPTAYPEAKLALDYTRLDLRPLERGAVVRVDGRFRRIADPRTSPLHGLRAVAGGVVGLRDVAATLKLARSGPAANDDPTTLETLRGAGLSATAIERVYSPFLGGVFLDGSLRTSSRFLRFVLDVFSRGPAALPASGMGAVSEQLAEGIDVRTAATVQAVGPGVVHLAGGERLEAQAVVVAAAGIVDDAPHGWNGVCCLYFDAPRAPLTGPWLVLGDGQGPIATLCTLSEAAREYARPGRSLVSVSVLGAGEPDLPAVRDQFGRWFGASASGWRHLRTYRLPHALPAWPAGRVFDAPVRLARRLYACGDHREHPSLNGALASGRRAAEAVLADVAVGAA